MNETTARARLEMMCPQAADPSLTNGEVDLLVQSAKRADGEGNSPTNVIAGAATWTASTAYQADDIIYVSATHRFWRCLYAGTSAATEPVWPDLTLRIPSSTVGTTRVYDASVTWVDNGAEWQPSWNLDYAAYLGWNAKAGKVAPRFDFVTDMQTFNRSQMYAHCIGQADRYRRAGAAGSTLVRADQ